MFGQIKDLKDKLEKLESKTQSWKQSENSIIVTPLKNHSISTESNWKLILLPLYNSFRTNLYKYILYVLVLQSRIIKKCILRYNKLY